MTFTLGLFHKGIDCGIKLFWILLEVFEASVVRRKHSNALVVIHWEPRSIKVALTLYVKTSIRFELLKFTQNCSQRGGILGSAECHRPIMLRSPGSSMDNDVYLMKRVTKEVPDGVGLYLCEKTPAGGSNEWEAFRGHPFTGCRGWPAGGLKVISGHRLKPPCGELLSPSIKHSFQKQSWANAHIAIALVKEN